VTLYEAFRQKELAGHYQRLDLDHPTKKQVRADWELPL
jgi:hypothetical protein